MKITQNAASSITLRRFDTGEEITFDEGVTIDVDNGTAAFLLNMKAYDENGKLITNFTIAS